MTDSQAPRLPLTAAQHGIWLGQTLDPTSPVYVAAECVEIHGPFSSEAFRVALRQTLSEAEALRVQIAHDESGPTQVVTPLGEVCLPTIELTEQDPWTVAQAWMRKDLTIPMDLRSGPLFRQALFHAGPEQTFWYQAVHHVVLDGFGFAQFTQRVAELYSALVEGRPLPPCKFGSLGSVVAEDAQYQTSEDRTRDREFWLQALAHRPPPASFAARAAYPSRRSLRHTDQLDHRLKQALDERAREHRGSWADALLAAVASYLHERTGASEVVLGLPVMARAGTAALRVPAMVMNIVPLRVDLRAGTSLAALVPQVRESLRTLRPHARYRYEHLRKDLTAHGARRRLFGPVVNIMPFDYGLRFAGQRALVHNLSAGPVEDLAIAVYARGGNLGARIDFDANPACYCDADLTDVREGFWRHLRAFLDPTARRTSHAVPQAHVEACLLEGEPLRVAAQDVVACILARATERPLHPALEDERGPLSYGALVTEARKLAALLSKRGAGCGRHVGIYLPRGREALIALLATLFSGAAYLPLDVEGPRGRTDSVLRDAQPQLVITAPQYLARLGGAADTVLLTDAAEMPLREPASAATADPAYVMYTSGSTGQPNGVQISRGALAHFVAAARQRYGFSCTDRVLHFAPLHFDASVEEIFVSLSVGATLVARTEDMLQSVDRFWEGCARHRISVLDLPTAFWHELAFGSTQAAGVPASVHTVIIGGEAALPERVARFQGTAGRSVRLLNTYGPTEATVVATCADLSVRTWSARDTIPIGAPLPGVRAAVITEDGRVGRPGEPGELVLLGPTLSLGYLARPELNRERFVTLTQLPDAPRAYRTGDQVRVEADGQLAFVGRLDEELKISGQRIHLREVENVLARFPGVREAAVVVHTSDAGQRHLSAHLAVGRAEVSVEALRRYARDHLLSVAVPGSFRLHEELPKTSSGKIDRQQLKGLPAALNVDAPEALSELERVVLNVYQQVLGHSAIATNRDFFELGGQSLQTIQLANRLSVLLGREVPVAWIFDHPSVSALAEALARTVHAERDEGFTAMLADAALDVPLQNGEETTLSTDLAFRSPSERGLTRRRPQQVLLTGATGFLGPYLLRELLDTSDARILCLVRANDEDHARARVAAVLQGQGISEKALKERVLPLAGQLGHPRLGLSETRYLQLAEECDAVVHNGASVSLVRSYASARGSNVLGTREALQFARLGKRKAFHHVSTLAVAAGAAEEVIPERFVDPHAGLRDGYTQTKWAAERLVRKAEWEGLDTVVYRLGRVTGPAHSGAVNPQDIVWRLLRAGLSVGGLPPLDVWEPWTPADIVARAIALNCARGEARGVLNLALSPPVHLREVTGWLRGYGYPLESLSFEEFRDRLRRSAAPQHQATLAFVDTRLGTDDANRPRCMMSVQCERARAALRPHGLEFPTLDRALAYRYFDSCVQTGFFPPPQATRDT